MTFFTPDTYIYHLPSIFSYENIYKFGIFTTKKLLLENKTIFKLHKNNHYSLLTCNHGTTTHFRLR